MRVCVDQSRQQGGSRKVNQASTLRHLHLIGGARCVDVLTPYQDNPAVVSFQSESIPYTSGFEDYRFSSCTTRHLDRFFSMAGRRLESR